MSLSKSNRFVGTLTAPAMRCALLVALCAAPLAAHAEAARADPIDTAMQSCSARADRSSTPGQVQCIEAARDAWQAAIDAAMRSIAADAPSGVKHAWMDSQTRWLAWRNDEIPLLRAVFQATRGSSYAITQANLQLQSVRDRALAVRHAASRFAPPPAAAASGASAALSSGSAPGSTAGAGVASDAPAALNLMGSRAQIDDPRKEGQRMRPCNRDAACEHAEFDLRRYERALREKLSSRERAALSRAQRAWTAYFDATAPLGTEADRADLIGERVATIKRLSETVGSD